MTYQKLLFGQSRWMFYTIDWLDLLRIITFTFHLAGFCIWATKYLSVYPLLKMTERRPVRNVTDLIHVDDYLIYTGIDQNGI